MALRQGATRFSSSSTSRLRYGRARKSLAAAIGSTTNRCPDVKRRSISMAGQPREVLGESTGGWLGRRSARRTGPLMMVVLLAAAGGVAVAGETLSVGRVLPGGESPGAPEYRHTEETVLAVGTHPQVGRWRITAYRSAELVDDGEVVQPAGLPCLRLLLSRTSDGSPTAGRSYCGEHGQNGLRAAALPVVDQMGNELNVLFGEAPEAAARVALRRANHSPQSAQLHEGPASLRGDVWILVTPQSQASEGRTRVDWLRSDGTAGGDEVDMTRELGRPPGAVPLGRP